MWKRLEKVGMNVGYLRQIPVRPDTSTSSHFVKGGLSLEGLLEMVETRIHSSVNHDY